MIAANIMIGDKVFLAILFIEIKSGNMSELPYKLVMAFKGMYSNYLTEVGSSCQIFQEISNRIVVYDPLVAFCSRGK